ncbi:hypothetical protein ABBQ32_001239 [Trebouxia sp. C0010 RCD-2024]
MSSGLGIFVKQLVYLMLQVLHDVQVVFLLSFCKVRGNIDVLSTYCIPKPISKPNTDATSASYSHAKYANGSTCPGKYMHCSRTESWSWLHFASLPNRLLHHSNTKTPVLTGQHVLRNA